MRVRIKGIPGKVTGFLVSMEHNGATLAGGEPLPFYDVTIRDEEEPRMTVHINAVPDSAIEVLPTGDEFTVKEE